jgi:glycosyltransferase involved in cell wall biosynthesis
MLPRAPRPELKQGRRFLCTYLGIMNKQDGSDLAIRAAEHYVRRLGRTDCHFAMLGSGECLDDMKRLVTELELDEWVTFTGWVRGDALLDYLATSDVAIAPDPVNALNEIATFVKILEYMAMGIPVVAFDMPETRISAGDAAAYVVPGNVEGLAGALQELLDDPERRARMGGVGRARIRDDLSWDRQKERYVEVFRALTR